MSPYNIETAANNIGVCTSQKQHGPVATIVATASITDTRPPRPSARCHTQRVVASHVFKYRDGRVPALLRLLFAQAALREMTIKELAAELRVSFGYLHQLRNGIKKIESVSVTFATAAAEFLNLPRLIVLHVAGKTQLTLFNELGPSGSEFYQHLTERASMAFRETDASIAEAESRFRT